jgi:hypothetical protein
MSCILDNVQGIELYKISAGAKVGWKFFICWNNCSKLEFTALQIFLISLVHIGYKIHAYKNTAPKSRNQFELSVSRTMEFAANNIFIYAPIFVSNVLLHSSVISLSVWTTKRLATVIFHLVTLQCLNDLQARKWTRRVTNKPSSVSIRM